MEQSALVIMKRSAGSENLTTMAEKIIRREYGVAMREVSQHIMKEKVKKLQMIYNPFNSLFRFQFNIFWLFDFLTSKGT